MADIFDFYVYDDRSIQYAIAEPIMLEDKDVTQFRFRIPKVLNNINMTSWEWWFIFVNAKKVKYTTQLTLSDDEDDPDNYSVATYTVGYGFSGYVGSVSFSIEALNVSGEDIVNEWHTRTYNTHVIDTLQGTRAVIPEPGGQAGTGLTAEEKSLILELFSKAAYAEDDASTAYDRLEALWTTTTRAITYNLSHVTSSNSTASIESGQRYTTTLTADSNYALNTVTVKMGGVDITSTAYSSGTITIPSVTGNIVITATAVLAAQSITATYTQSGTVYDTDSLDSLKADLVVTANYSGGTSETVPSTDYTLSGTLEVGTSTITVSYAGLTDTFSVTVSVQDTTAQIAKEGYVSEHTGTGTSASNYRETAKTYGGITIKYQLDAATTSLQLAGIIPFADSTITKGVGCLIIYDSTDTIVNHLDEQSNTSPNRWAQLATGTLTEFVSTLYTVGTYSQITFSVDTRYLDDAYMYDYVTGQVFFAGENTPYYGMTNISEAGD